MHVWERAKRKPKLFMGFVLSFGVLAGAWAAHGAEQPASAGRGSIAANQSNDTPKDSKPGTGSPALQQRRPRYRLEPGDALELDFPFSPEFNQSVTIQPDGYIALRGVGELYAQGKTVPELTASLRETYGEFLHDPVVTVDPKDLQKPYFVAGGELVHPGKYDLRSNTTVAEAVAIAGGFTPNSKHSEVLLFRRVTDSYVEAKKINVKKMLNTANLQEDAYLHPGDMLYVPKSRISKIQRFLPTQSLSMYFSPLP